VGADTRKLASKLHTVNYYDNSSNSNSFVIYILISNLFVINIIARYPPYPTLCIQYFRGIFIPGERLRSFAPPGRTLFSGWSVKPYSPTPAILEAAESFAKRRTPNDESALEPNGEGTHAFPGRPAPSIIPPRSEIQTKLTP
jgi:hypothetical protein